MIVCNTVGLFARCRGQASKGVNKEKPVGQISRGAYSEGERGGGV